ncbi:hypothetical protein FM076_01190 [Streptomyces albus subsp. chlorinus]|uniref:hypothetical protein n=1 Tax=Streptomyces albus TaxID=1888 RepID=UPI00156F9A84|nr:hypothetical protein [Streptomyces albus]NSC19896.1 hypothetical protein [Streptomyces albus subsp. chlorinus]
MATTASIPSRTFPATVTLEVTGPEAAAKARLLVPARRAEAGRAALRGTEGRDVNGVDLADAASVRAAAARSSDR